MGTYNNDAMASGVAGAYGSVIDMNTYQQYTESGKGSGRREGMQKIDPDSGIAPRRCTDLVCVAIFAIYCLMMIVVLWVVKSREVGDHPYSDIRRLTHGMDYKARLCGIDPGVEEKPFLFFCRATPSDGNFAVVSADQKGNLLNLGHPICVESCPTWSNLTDGGKTQKGPYLVECLMPESTLKEPIIKKNPAGNMPFGIVESYFFVVKEETMQTITYSTHLLAGRYCLPTNSTLKAKIVGLTGPLSPAKRLHLSIGSYGDCWGVMFGVAFMSVCLSYLYVFVIGRVKNAAKKVVNTTLTLVYILFVLAGVFFLAAILNYVPEVSGTPFMKYYMGKNTFFERDSQTDATVTSTVLGALLLAASAIPLGLMLNTGNELEHSNELISVAWTTVTAMPSMLVMPAVEALVRFFIMYAVCYNFMYIVSVGLFDDYRIKVDDVPLEGMSQDYAFDLWIIPWMLLYIFGGFWAMEVVTSFGQFLISFCGILYYFTKKGIDDEKEVPRRPSADGLYDAIRYHFGSIILGAAGIWIFRFSRLFWWFENEAILNGTSECCNCCSCFDGLIQSIGNCLDGIRGDAEDRANAAKKRKKEDPIHQRWTKDAYQDVIIRSQHFLTAMDKSRSYIDHYPPVQQYTGKLTMITIVGVLWIGTASASAAYSVMAFHSRYNNPAKDTYIPDPMGVACLAFFLSGSIAYGFCALIDHMADTLLYCFAFNRKFNKAAIKMFVPDTLMDLVGHDGVDQSGYGMYGKAKPEMYLSNWIQSTNRKNPRDKVKEDANRLAKAYITQTQSQAAGSAQTPTDSPNTGGFQQQGYGGYR